MNPNISPDPLEGYADWLAQLKYDGHCPDAQVGQQLAAQICQRLFKP